MHNSNEESKSLDILTFEEALKPADNSKNYDKERWIFVPNFYTDYRYILGSIGKKPLITIGINPSTAEPDNLDNTLKSVNRIANYNGFDSFIMFNVYAQRATKSDDIDKEFNEILHRENMKAFRWVLEHSGGSPTIWAAWGTIIEKRKYLRDCLSDMVEIGNEYDSKWVRTGMLSKKGHPHHPLYLCEKSVLDDFDMATYLEKI